MNRQITVKELKKLCEYEIKHGNGDKNIVISDDNEANGFHGLFCGFTNVKGWENRIYDSVTNEDNNTILLG